MLLAERKGFEPLRLLGKRFSRPPRYDHFDTSPNALIVYHFESGLSRGLDAFRLFSRKFRVFTLPKR